MYDHMEHERMLHAEESERLRREPYQHRDANLAAAIRLDGYRGKQS